MLSESRNRLIGARNPGLLMALWSNIAAAVWRGAESGSLLRFVSIKVMVRESQPLDFWVALSLRITSPAPPEREKLR
jgi:hypothetical protein